MFNINIPMRTLRQPQTQALCTKYVSIHILLNLSILRSLGSFSYHQNSENHEHLKHVRNVDCVVTKKIKTNYKQITMKVKVEAFYFLSVTRNNTWGRQCVHFIFFPTVLHFTGI